LSERTLGRCASLRPGLREPHFEPNGLIRNGRKISILVLSHDTGEKARTAGSLVAGTASEGIRTRGATEDRHVPGDNPQSPRLFPSVSGHDLEMVRLAQKAVQGPRNQAHTPDRKHQAISALKLFLK
ncbi:MAG: hypothetical protein CGW95_01940, partial [Phenylobacterium zucineum]